MRGANLEDAWSANELKCMHISPRLLTLQVSCLPSATARRACKSELKVQAAGPGGDAARATQMMEVQKLNHLLNSNYLVQIQIKSKIY